MPDKTTKIMEILVKLRDNASSGFKSISKEMLASAKSGKLLERSVVRLRSRVDDLRSAVFSLQGALLAVGIGLTARSFLDASRQSENYRLRLNALLGSVEKGNQLFQEMAKFAGQVPFSYEEIMGAATQLSGVMKGGIDEIKEWMPIIADLAAVAGLDIQTTTQQIVRMYSAGAASADLFRERGITAMLGFQAGVSYSAEKTKEQIIKAFEDPQSKFRGATKEMAKSWDGMMSMIGDKWFQFRNLVMDAGVFDALKSALSDINERFGTWIQRNKTIIGIRVPEYVKKVKDFFVEFLSVAQNIDQKTLGLGLVAWMLYGKAGGIAILLGIGYTTKEIKKLREELEKTGEVKLKEGKTLLERIFGRYDDITTIEKRLAKARKELENLRNASEFEKRNVYFSEDLSDRIKKAEEKVKGLQDRLYKLQAPKVVVDLDVQASEDAKKYFTWVTDEGPANVPTPRLAPLKMRLQAELKEVKNASAVYLSELDYRYSRGEIMTEQYYADREKKLRDTAAAEIKILDKLRKDAGEDPAKKFPLTQKIKETEEKLDKELTALGRKRTKDEEDRDKKRIDRAISTASKLTDIELQNLDDLYKDKEAKDADYFNKRWEIVKKASDAEIKYLEEKKKAASTKEAEEIDQQIADKRIESYNKLVEVARNYYDERKKINDLIMSQRGQMLGAFEGSTESFKKVEDDWLKYQYNQIAQQYVKFKEFYQNDELANKWLAEKKSQFLDQWLQKTNFVYGQLKNLSQRTAEAIEQSFSDFFFNIFQGKLNNLKDVIRGFGDSIQRAFADIFGQMAKKLFTDQIEKLFKKYAESAYDSKGAIAGIDQEITKVQLLTKQYMALAAAKALAMASSGFAGTPTTGVTGGGYFVSGYGLSEGGSVPGKSPHSKADNILLAGTAGEFMQPVSAVKYYGQQVMEAIRSKAIPRSIFSGFRMPNISSPPRRSFGYATGGSVGGGGLKVEIENKNPTPSQVTDASYDPRREVISLVLDAVDKNVDGSGNALSALLSKR